jgi:hypothetical protein
MASLQDEVRLLDSLNPVIVALSPHDSSAAVLDGFAAEFPDAYSYISVGEPILFPATEISLK